MNKDAIRELIDLRTDISTVNITPYVIKPVVDRLNSIIIDLMDEGRDDETCCTCEDCPVMKKMDNFIEATKLREWLMETAPKATSMTADEILEAEKMARGGTD